MQNFKFYGLAFVIVVVTTLVSTGLQIAAGYLPDDRIVSILAANLSGITIGSIIMVIGFLRDNRVAQEQERTEQERKRADAAEARVLDERKRADARAAEERERADRERERADRLMDEMNAVRKQYTDATDALIKRLQELDAGDRGGRP